MTPRCRSRAPLGQEAARCDQADGHTGRHTAGLLVWHDPPRILNGGTEPDHGRDTERWRAGQVRLTGDDTP